DGANNEAIGLVAKKDVLKQLLEGGEFDPVAVMMETIHVPDSKPVLEMLDVFKGAPWQIAFVVDEFGSFQGVVTQTDVMESIAGDLPEEHESHEPPSVQQKEDGSFLVEGRADVDELTDALDLPPLEDVDFHTVA